MEALNKTKHLYYIETPAGNRMRQEMAQREAVARQQQEGIKAEREIWEKYTGDVATGYDEKRQNDPKWITEDKIIRELMDDLPEEHWVLDCPCGTGRFFDLYKEKGFCVKARDKSPDMIKLAAEKAEKIGVDGRKFSICRDDILELDTLPEDSCVDASLMVRLTRWLTSENCQKALKQLQRVTRDRIIITARIANSAHARPIKLFTDALEDDWELAENREGSEPDYRILMFKRTK